ncbi:MAG: GNAT family protein [Candidatus Methylomirabilota bacterium]
MVTLRLPLPGCVVRSYRPEDAAALVRHGDDRRVWRNLRDRFPHPYSHADAVSWIRQATSDRPEVHFAVALDGQAVGGIGLELQSDIHRRSAEIGYWLGASCWGRGIATEAVRAVTAYGFSRFELCRIYALVFEWNPASGRVLEKAGYSLEGRLRRAVVKEGQVLDAFLYAVVAPGGPAAPPAD